MSYARVHWLALLLAVAIAVQQGTISARQKETPGFVPIAMRIPRALVDTTVEPLQISDGSPENPAGTWTVGWYEEYGPLGDGDNAVFYGYPDFFGVGPADFWFLPGLREGDAVEVLGDDGLVHPYRASAVSTYERASAPIGEIFADTGEEMLTLFTNAPPYDDDGNYLSLVVVRAVPAGDPIVPNADAWSGTNAAACALVPQSLTIEGRPVVPVDAGPTARDDVDLTSAEPADEQTLADVRAILQAATRCPIAVREALVLADGRVITLIGPPGVIPLDVLTAPGGFDALATAPEGKAFAYVLFLPSNGGWQAAGAPWYAGSS